MTVALRNCGVSTWGDAVELAARDCDYATLVPRGARVIRHHRNSKYAARRSPDALSIDPRVSILFLVVSFTKDVSNLEALSDWMR